MIETIKNIIILILSVISGSIPIVTIIVRKYQKTKLEGIEKIAKAIESGPHEKLKEQWRIVKERCNLLFAEFQTIFCTNLCLSSESKEAKYYESLILNNVRKKTDELMREVLETNNIAARQGQSWILYKKSKKDFILGEVIKYIQLIYNDDLIGISHEEAIKKCRKDIVSAYDNHIGEMFDEIYDISVSFAKKKKEQEEFLARLKNGKKKR